jgi:hypothetical protein
MKASHVWNGHIVRQSRRACSHLIIDRRARNLIYGLGLDANKLFEGQDERLWEIASSHSFLPTLMSGATVLQRLGRSNQQPLKLEDTEAHLAFVACAALALMAADLTRSKRKALLQTLNLLAMCCPVTVKFESMPPPAVMPADSRAKEAIRRQYRNFASPEGTAHDVMLADAVILLQIFQQGQRAQDSAIVVQLDEVTKGLRTATQRLQLSEQAWQAVQPHTP